MKKLKIPNIIDKVNKNGFISTSVLTEQWLQFLVNIAIVAQMIIMFLSDDSASAIFIYFWIQLIINCLFYAAYSDMTISYSSLKSFIYMNNEKYFKIKKSSVSLILLGFVNSFYLVLLPKVSTTGLFFSLFFSLNGMVSYIIILELINNNFRKYNQKIKIGETVIRDEISDQSPYFKEGDKRLTKNQKQIPLYYLIIFIIFTFLILFFSIEYRIFTGISVIFSIMFNFDLMCKSKNLRNYGNEGHDLLNRYYFVQGCSTLLILCSWYYREINLYHGRISELLAALRKLFIDFSSLMNGQIILIILIACFTFAFGVIQVVKSSKEMLETSQE